MTRYTVMLLILTGITIFTAVRVLLGVWDVSLVYPYAVGVGLLIGYAIPDVIRSRRHKTAANGHSSTGGRE